MIKLATVSPCYNEEEVLHHSVERLTTLFERMIAEGLISDDSMMVFVNDGSRDRTWEIIRELHQKNKFVRGINLARNVGHQNAIMAGMMYASAVKRTTLNASPRWSSISRKAMTSSTV